jgi:hypothetical protein
MFRAAVGLPPVPHIERGDRYQTKKYASAMITANATPNQIMG